jgi:pimeloyl-ACP methyl ester carboxylesterase
MMNYTAWRSSGERVRIAERDVFVRVAGEGPVLLFLHGFPTTSYDFEPVITRLSARFRCVSFDFAGFGDSDPPARWDYDTQTDLALAVAKHLGIVHAIVVAHDYGVSVAQEWVARQHEGALSEASCRVDAVVFLNGGVEPALHRPIPIQRLLAGPLGGLLAPLLIRRGTFVRSLARVLVQVESFDAEEHWQAVSARGSHRHAHEQLHYIAERKRRRARWVGAFSDARIPIALAWGEGDPVSGAHVLAWARTQRPDAEVAALPVGHYPQLEAPEEVAALIQRFAEKLG